MILGMTYAQFVAGVSAGIILGPVKDTDKNYLGRHDIALTYGTNSTSKRGPGQDGFLTVTAKPYNTLFDRFTPIYSVGVSIDGAVYASAGFGKRIDIFGLEVFPHWSPALYQKNLSNGFSLKELIQFKTGIDVSFRLTDDIYLTGGLYHMSNAKISSKSAGIDVTHLGISFRF